jgi:hypothetical protein
MIDQRNPVDVVGFRGVAAKKPIRFNAGWTIDAIFLNETSNNEVTGGLKIGTTDGGADVVAAQAVGALSLGHIAEADILKRVFSRTASTTLFIDAVTGWNSAVVDVVIFCRKAF